MLAFLRTPQGVLSYCVFCHSFLEERGLHRPRGWPAAVSPNRQPDAEQPGPSPVGLGVEHGNRFGCRVRLLVLSGAFAQAPPPQRDLAGGSPAGPGAIPQRVSTSPPYGGAGGGRTPGLSGGTPSRPRPVDRPCSRARWQAVATLGPWSCNPSWFCRRRPRGSFLGVSWGDLGDSSGTVRGITVQN